MFKNKKPVTCAFMLAAGLFLFGCTREKGFISDNIYYIENPFTITQGITTTSSALVADGSTAPLTVKLLALRDASGNNADSVLRTPQSIVTFTGTITQADSTLAMLQAKLKDSLVRPFNINEIGGRLQFTAATKFVPIGSYKMDVAVTNIRGTRVIQNACNINIQPLEQVYNIYYNRIRYLDSAGTADLNVIVNSDLVKVEHTSGTAVSKVIYKFVDKNNKPFNPKRGDVSRWNVGTTASIFEDWDPYYQPQYTDSTIEEQIPSYGISFPYFRKVVVNGVEWEDGNPNIQPALCRYKISASSNKQNLLMQSFTSLEFLTSGTYVVTVYIPDIEVK